MKYEVNVKFDGSNGWQKICDCATYDDAQAEIERQKHIEDDGDCEYTIIKRAGRPPKGSEARKAVTIRLQPSVADKLKRLAADGNVSQSDIIESLIDKI